MKNLKSLLFFALTLSLICLSACHGNKKDNEEKTLSVHDAFVGSLSSQDTTDVINLCYDFFAMMKSGEKDSAFDMLKSIDEKDNIVELSNEQKAKISTTFTMFPVLDYHQKDFKIGEAENNICSFAVVFNRDEATGQEDVINFGFCPVKVGGKWYLTVRNASADL